MLNTLRIAAAVVVLLSLAAPCVAADASAVPEAKRTTLGLYLTSEEVPSFLAQTRGHTLFVDVRAPEELAATGVATLVDANVPLFVLSSADGKPRPNPDFLAQVEGRLAAKGLTKTDIVVVICRTGRRSAMATNLLAEAGLTHVYSVIDGFMGDGEGSEAGTGGWRSKGLPWRYP
jgi:rhodanese-related sulfurtransferase